MRYLKFCGEHNLMMRNEGGSQYEIALALIVDGGGKRYRTWVSSANDALIKARRWQMQHEIERVTSFFFNPEKVIEKLSDWNGLTVERVRARTHEIATFSIDRNRIKLGEEFDQRTRSDNAGPSNPIVDLLPFSIGSNLVPNLTVVHDQQTSSLPR